MGYRSWEPSKKKLREYAQQMAEIDAYCNEHGISQSASSDSYYFSHNGINYRISNHTRAASNAKAISWTGEQVREKYHTEANAPDVDIFAGKTRIIEIHKAILAGHTLDKRGYIVRNTATVAE